MKALVTGGAGFIGSNITKKLADEGHEVIVLDNLLSGHRDNIENIPNVRFVEGDIRDQDIVEKAMYGCDTIFHLAASVGNKRSIDNPIDDADINVMGTIRILEAMRKTGANKIIVSSSAGIFGELKTLPILENHDIEPDSPYGCTKLCEEKLCLSYAKLYNLEAICLRYFNVYGPNQRFDAYGNVIPIFIFQMLQNQPITIYGDGDQTRDFVSVHDVVQANINSAMTKGISGAFNLGSGSRITINRLAELCQKTVMNQIPGISPKITYGKLRQGDVRHSLADISAAKNAFTFQPQVRLEEGLQEYVKWAWKEVNIK